MDTGYEGAAVWCDFTDKLAGKTDVPDCRMLGGMRAFRAVKSGFEALLVREPVRRLSDGDPRSRASGDGATPACRQRSAPRSSGCS